jgi:sec-independent protein translocase protein TatA
VIFNDILQPTHLLLIFVVALLVLGPKRLPEAARSIGRGMHDFRSSITGEPHPERVTSEATPAEPAKRTV